MILDKIIPIYISDAMKKKNSRYEGKKTRSLYEIITCEWIEWEKERNRKLANIRGEKERELYIYNYIYIYKWCSSIFKFWTRNNSIKIIYEKVKWSNEIWINEKYRN